MMEIVNYNTAKIAKEKGFNEVTKGFYKTDGTIDGWMGLKIDGIKENDCIKAPYQDQLRKWLRENHDIHITIPKRNHYNRPYTYEIYNHDKKFIYYFPSYESALETGLEESLKLIK